MVRRAGDRPPVARIDGREVSLDEAVDAAAAILRQARAPLVYGLGPDELRGAAPGGGARRGDRGRRRSRAAAAARALAYQAIGSSTATFGEIRDRAELVVVWRADPAVTHPRLLGRLRLDRAARGARALVVVDAQRTATAEEADAFVELDAAHDFEALWALRALVGGAPLDRDRAGDLPLDALGELARLLGARHVAFIHGALDELGALALFSLVRDLSRDRHAVTLALRGDGNARGAEDVLAWQTGFPAAVSFARGHPREPRRAQRRRAARARRGRRRARGGLRSARRRLPAPARAAHGGRRRARHRRRRRRRAWRSPPRPTASRCAGTVHRMDGVPVPLRAPLDGDRPSVEDVLAAIAGRL